MSGSFLEKIFTTIFSILLIAGLQAQPIQSNFKGTIVDESDSPLVGATIMILEAKIRSWFNLEPQMRKALF